MRILGIDPGTATTGFGVIEVTKGICRYIDAGCILTSKRSPLPERLDQIATDVSKLIKLYEPDCVSIESLFFFKNMTTAMSVSHARGVILQVSHHRGVAIAEYTPLQVKQALTGYGRADKKQMQKMVQALLKLREVPKPDDAADGLALAITHAHYVKHVPGRA